MRHCCDQGHRLTHGQEAYPDDRMYQRWKFEGAFVNASDHYGPWHSHDSAPRMGPCIGLADVQKKSNFVQLDLVSAPSAEPHERWAKVGQAKQKTKRPRHALIMKNLHKQRDTLPDDMHTSPGAKCTCPAAQATGQVRLSPSRAVGSPPKVFHKS